MLLIFAVALVVGIIQDDGGGTPTTSRSVCERRWAENRATAETPYMTEERYISNCMESNRDLLDGKLDGR